MVAVVAAKHRTKHGLTFLRSKATVRVQVINRHAQVRTAAHIAREHETNVVLVEVSDEALFVSHARIGCRGVIEGHILRCDDIRRVGVGKDEVCSLIAIEIDTRLDRGDEIRVGGVGDGVVIQHVAHGQVHV